MNSESTFECISFYMIYISEIKGTTKYVRTDDI